MPRGSQRSVDLSRFAMVPRNDVPRSAFDIQTGHKTTFQAGLLIPVLVTEVLPGDSIRCNMTALCRLATPVKPLMDNLILESFFFFVPNRLVWEHWENFMGEQASPSDTTDYLVPRVSLTPADVVPGSMADYFGLTNNVAGAAYLVNVLPFRAYSLIWNDWFRDEDLQTPATVPMGDGPDAIGIFGLRYRGKRHDYFTSCRPWPSKPATSSWSPGLGLDVAKVPGAGYAGFTAYSAGVGASGVGAPVSGIGFSVSVAPTVGPGTIFAPGQRGVPYDRYYGSANLRIAADSATNFPDIRVMINDIRQASMIQTLLERNARGGSRYTELIRSHFGVISPDARLQRPEYLGGGRDYLTVNPVAQTSATGIAGTTTPQGNLAGVGTAVARKHGFSQSFTEHGYVLGLVSVRSDLTYQQGVNRMWWRRGKFDFYWPALAHLPEQPVLNREIYVDGSANDEYVFGYQERWAEYRNIPSRTSGLFRSTAGANKLDYWHLAQQFAALPVLNDVFIRENPPVDRVVGVPGVSESYFLFDSIFDLRMVRALPMFSIPGMGPRL